VLHQAAGKDSQLRYNLASLSRESPVGEERRRAPRYPFIAAAEVIDQASRASASARVTDLSLFGCYIDMVNPPRQGVQVVVKIHSEGKFFEAPGTVAYSQPNLGMGVNFHDVPHEFRIVLKEWLLTAAKVKYGPGSPQIP